MDDRTDLSFAERPNAVIANREGHSIVRGETLLRAKTTGGDTYCVPTQEDIHKWIPRYSYYWMTS